MTTTESRLLVTSVDRIFPSHALSEDGYELGTLWLLIAPENYQRLVVQRGWSHQAYQKWLVEAVMTQLFARVFVSSARRFK